MTLKYDPGKDSENSTIAPPPVLPSAAYSITPERLLLAREYLAAARKNLSDKTNHNDDLWKGTAAGMVILALEALFGTA